MVMVHELIAWDLDDYPDRGFGTGFNQEPFIEAVRRAKLKLAERACYESYPALLDEETAHIHHLLADQMQRTEIRREYEGLEWKLGVVDLRHVLAFQRRLVFSPKPQKLQIPKQENWDALLSLSFGPARDTKHSVSLHEENDGSSAFRIESDNPDLQFRLIAGAKSSDCYFSLYGGSPFFEVAEFRGRWFLRDGYHRAYRLLQAGIHHLPAVIIHARTMAEVGATQPWFFNEEQLFASRPPRVMDFLDNDIVLLYQRRRFKKVIQISIEESFQPMDGIDEVQGDKL
jgi:hypothetical protein